MRLAHTHACSSLSGRKPPPRSAHLSPVISAACGTGSRSRPNPVRSRLCKFPSMGWIHRISPLRRGPNHRACSPGSRPPIKERGIELGVPDFAALIKRLRDRISHLCIAYEGMPWQAEYGAIGAAASQAMIASELGGWQARSRVYRHRLSLATCRQSGPRAQPWRAAHWIESYRVHRHARPMLGS